MSSPTSSRSLLLRHSVSFDDYESFPHSTHESVFANEKESWHSPPENKPKLRVTCFAVFTLGLNNAAFGSLLPLIQLHNKNVTYFENFYLDQTAFFLPPLVGLLASGLLSLWLHRRMGMRGVLVLGAMLLSISYGTIALTHEYLLLLCSLVFTGFGFGLINTCLGSWVGAFLDVQRSLTILQSWYYFGGIVSSVFIYTIHHLNIAWYSFFYLMTALSVILLYLGATTFKDEGANSFAFRVGYSTDSYYTKAMIREVFATKHIIPLAIFLFIASGLQVACSSWVPMVMYSFPTKGYSPNVLSLEMECSFWLGLTIGSIVLYKVSQTFKTIFKASTVYLFMSLLCSILLLVGRRNQIFTLINVFLFGFFLGPLHTSGMTQITTSLPEYLHVIGVFIITSTSQVGLATIPFLVGFLPCMLGSAIIFPAFLFFLIVLGVSWYTVYRHRAR